MTLHLAASRRFSLALAAGAALGAGLSPNRAELALALAEWRSREDDATVRAVLDRRLDSEIARQLFDAASFACYPPGSYVPESPDAEAIRNALNEGWS